MNPNVTAYSTRAAMFAIVITTMSLGCSTRATCYDNADAGFVCDPETDGGTTGDGETGLDTVDIPGDGDPTGDGDGDGDGDCEPGTEGCECVPPAAMVVECDQDTLCWTWSSGWSAWAQYAEPTDILAAIEGGVLTPTLDDLGVGAVCFDLLGANHHVCVVAVDCIGLLGRPATEVDMVQSECAAKGPWEFVGETPDPFGACWGVVNGVAVMLDIDH